MILALQMILVANPTTINVFWDTIEDATKYNIVWWKSEGDIGDGGNDTVDNTENLYNIQNLRECTDYVVSLEAVKGEEQLQIEEKSTQTEPQAPFPVLGMQVNPLENEPTLEVEWIPVVPVGNCDLIYTITWAFYSTPDKEERGNTTEPHYSITGLNFYTDYKVCVTSSVEGLSANSKCDDETTVTGIPGGPPENINGVNSTTEALTVEWDPPATPNGVITNYSVTWSPDDPSEPIITTATTFTLTDLKPCTDYTISISAATAKGNGPLGESSQTTLPKVPDSPSDLVVASVVDQSDSLDVSWIQAVRPGRCDITSNTISWFLNSTGDQVGSMVLNSTESYRITGLDPWTKYLVCVSAATQGGNGPTTPYVDQTTDEDIPGGPPENVKVKNYTTSDSISVEWDPPASPNGVITRYLISWSPHDPTEPVTTKDTNYTLMGLLPCTTYTITISATTSKGSGPPSDTSDTTQPDGLAAPTNLQKTSNTETEISVSWMPPNISSNCQIVSYSLWWEKIKSPVNISPNVTQYTITNLSPETLYQISVAANYGSSTGAATTLKAKTTKDGSNVGAIVGGVIGGLALVAILGVAVLKRNKLKKMMRRDKKFRMVRREREKMQHSHGCQ
ncbi:hypothetical protein Pcinc_014855 [Petrolisthes cinctipes]|uniref:Fibronectin type-III domain-containing protein n=1 Tax=Petrolisthes cinctipes TaxID=88211 RepID=A0AAE1FW49_PETCI|nr:hypothetical protein Pcinc_014855 [Petrolisthes cinctipes]